MVSGRLFLSPASPWTCCCVVQGDRHCGGPAGMTGWGEVGRLDGQPWGPLGVHSPPGDGEATRLPYPGSSSSRSRGLPRPPTHPPRDLFCLGPLDPGMRQEARRPAPGHTAAPCPGSVQAQPRQTPAGSLQILTRSRSLRGLGPSANATSGSLRCCCQSSAFAWQGQGTRSCLPAQVQGPPRALPGTSRPRNTVPRACASGAFQV